MELPARERARAAKALGVGLREDPPQRHLFLEGWHPSAATAIGDGITIWSKAAASTSSRWLLALNPSFPAFLSAYFRTTAGRPIPRTRHR